MSTKKTSTPQQQQQKLEALDEALDDVPIDVEDARETVAKLGVDVNALANGIRAKIASADAESMTTNRRKRISQARAAYSKEVVELEHRRVEPERTREEQLLIFEALLKKAPPHASLAMHFHKYEGASKEELAELIRGLRYLLGEDD